MLVKPTYTNTTFVDYKAVFDNLQNGLHIYQLEDFNDDYTLRMVGANQAAADLTGVPVDELIGKTLDDSFPGLRDKGIPQRCAEVVRSGEPAIFDDVYYSDHHVALAAFLVKAFPLPGNCVGVMFENITERRKMEEELRENKAQLQSLFDNMLSGFAFHQIITNENGDPIDYVFLDVNKKFEQFTGIKRNDLLGRKVTEVYPDIKFMDFDWIATCGKIALTGESTTFEQYFAPQNKWYLLSAYSPRKGYFAVTFNDITDSKLFNATLREKEERYHALFEQMPSGVAVYKAIDGAQDFIIKELNQSAERIENVISAEITGRRVTDVFTGVRACGLLDAFRRVWETGKSEFVPATFYSDETRLETWRENWVYKLPSGDIVSLYNDVTPRKNGEKELREAIKRQVEIARAANVGLWDWDIKTNKVSYSAEWKKQIGYDETEISDDFEEWKSRVHPEDLKPIIEEIKQVIADLRQDYSTEFRFRHKDGSYRWIFSQASVIHNDSGRALRLVGSHVDITERKHLENERFRTTQQMTSLVNELIDAIVVTSLSGVIRFVNSSACLFFGRSCSDLIGIDLGLTIDLGNIFEISAHQPEGTIRYAEAKSTLIDWGNERSYLISLRDITERKRAIEEHERLEKQIKQVQKMESIGNLAGGIAHDFNNMLSVILGHGEELVNALESSNPLRDSAMEIVTAGRRSADLTRQLLAFSRRQTLQVEVVDLNEVITNLKSVLCRLIEEDIVFTTFLANETVNVEVDPNQLGQVLINLAVNARDAMPDGGKLTIETANVHLDEKCKGYPVDIIPGDYAMLTISDNGCGMDRVLQTKIFEPFFTTKEKGKGTGLGLSTVYGIVKQLRGYIWVYSEPGHGTAFKIYLPKATNEPSMRKVYSSDDSIEGKGEMILVVEDESGVQRLCQRVLNSLNYKVTIAANGREALHLIEEEKLRPNLIITDVVMPEMNGKVLIDRLQNHLPEIKYLYMSGYTNNSIVSSNGIINSGVNFIQKPFSKEEIGTKIRSILDESALTSSKI